ncbi:hypothetical protein HKBW3S44_01620, partial [Candidatus Hakubella thermalkaliphila]
MFWTLGLVPGIVSNARASWNCCAAPPCESLLIHRLTDSIIFFFFAVVFLGAENLAFFPAGLVYVTVVLFILLMVLLIYFHR